MAKQGRTFDLQASSLSIWAMVIGISSLFRFYLALPLAITGLVLSIVALKKVSSGEAGGKGYALTGLITSIIGLLWFLMYLVFFLLIWGMAMSSMIYPSYY